jgi:hypothetical protein
MALVNNGRKCYFENLIDGESLSGKTQGSPLVSNHIKVEGSERAVFLIEYTPASVSGELKFRLESDPRDPDEDSPVWYDEVFEDVGSSPVELTKAVYTFTSEGASVQSNIRFATSIADTYIRLKFWEENGGAGGTLSVLVEASNV